MILSANTSSNVKNQLKTSELQSPLHLSCKEIFNSSDVGNTPCLAFLLSTHLEQQLSQGMVKAVFALVVRHARRELILQPNPFAGMFPLDL